MIFVKQKARYHNSSQDATILKNVPYYLMKINFATFSNNITDVRKSNRNPYELYRTQFFFNKPSKQLHRTLQAMHIPHAEQQIRIADDKEQPHLSKLPGNSPRP